MIVQKPLTPYFMAISKPRSNVAHRTVCIAASAKYSDLPLPKDFDSTANDFAIGIMGDLHLPASPEAEEYELFHQARDQLREMTTSNASAARILQLGDLGSYEKGWPGSRNCFAAARSYLESFNLPTALILGNHDLEADEFETDQENLEVWHQSFNQRHYWAADVGPATMIGLSTVRFRSNAFSVHEVHVDDEQLAFLEATLEDAKQRNRPVVMYTHAPIIGSGLKVIQTVHVKNRCAWINHSSEPHRFIQLVEKYSNIRLWFSGHFHLSQSYPDSISIVGGTAFVLTGVIGDRSSRDGHRHSRLLKGNENGFELYTVDHDAASLRLDLRGSWTDPSPPEYLVPEAELLCDPSQGWLCSPYAAARGLASTRDNCIDAAEAGAKWLNSGKGGMLCFIDGVVVEYDTKTLAAIGAVFLDVPDGHTVRLVDAAGVEIDAVYSDGTAAVAVEMLNASGEVVDRVERNERGGFYKIFQPNKWVARKLKEKEEMMAAAAAAAAGKA